MEYCVHHRRLTLHSSYIDLLVVIFFLLNQLMTTKSFQMGNISQDKISLHSSPLLLPYIQCMEKFVENLQALQN
jgi:hypothetical protein